MIHTTSLMVPVEIIARGYTSIGIFEYTSTIVQEYIMQSTINNKYDLYLLQLDKDGEVVQLFVKDKSV